MYREKLLVVANQTVDSDELHDALRERNEHGPVTVTLLVPQVPLQRDHRGGRRYRAELLGYVDRPQTTLRDDYRRITRHARQVVERVFYGRE